MDKSIHSTRPCGSPAASVLHDLFVLQKQLSSLRKRTKQARKSVEEITGKPADAGPEFFRKAFLAISEKLILQKSCPCANHCLEAVYQALARELPPEESRKIERKIHTMKISNAPLTHEVVK